jgi:hypothetical protein
MSRVNLEGQRGEDMRISRKWKLSRLSVTLNAGFVVSKDHPPVLLLDANGAARNCDLPAITTDMDGMIFLIRNMASGAFAITVRNAALATVGTAAQNQGVMMYCDGTSWISLAIV